MQIGEKSAQSTLAAQSAGVLSAGDRVRVTAGAGPARFIVLAGKPLHEPVVQHGPFVMNSRAEIEQAIQEAGYDGVYRGVYPIKVNQQQQVVEEITGFGRIYHHGLEAGSKAELTAALAYLDDPEAYIVCNGYKDQAFIDLALYATKMGIQTILVVEMPTEVESILDRADALGVRPQVKPGAPAPPLAACPPGFGAGAGAGERDFIGACREGGVLYPVAAVV